MSDALDLPEATLTTEAVFAVRQTFTQAATDAATRIVDLSLGHDKLAFEANKYIIEYALGKPGNEGGTSDPWAEYLERLKAND